MTQDEILKIANDMAFMGSIWIEDDSDVFKDMIKFAKLVAAKEREAINSLAEKELLNTSALMSMPPQSSAAWNILQAIRARGDL